MKNIKLIFPVCFSFLLLLNSCGSKSNDYPWIIDPNSLTTKKTDKELIEGQLLGAMGMMISYQPHAYQYQRSNSIDAYSGYMSVSQRGFLFGGTLESTYTFPNPYFDGSNNLSGVANQLHDVYFKAEANGVPEYKAIAQIIYAYTAQEVTDFFGPIPYEDYRNLKVTSPITYEPVDTVYFKILRDLRDAITVLKKQKPTNVQLSKVEGPYGGLSRGDWKMWVKFANSLRLRMALTMVKAEPNKAQMEAESAVNDEIGVLKETDFDIAFTETNTGSKTDHPLYSISVGWDDQRLGASLENILKRMQNPLLGVWFSKNPYPINDNSGNPSGFDAQSDYFGIRQGILMIDKSNKQQGYGMFSTINPLVHDMPRSYLKVAEVLFSLAEGALRGWNMGGTAEQFYYMGIKRSFDENELTAQQYNDYILKEEPEPIDYIDPYDRDNDIEGRVMVGVKWDETDSREVMLEKIITQKYIANFPMSAEAWTTFRRTGYPRLFPVRFNYWPSVDTELQLRRCPYRVSVQTQNDIEGSQSGSVVNALKGPNVGGTRLWWDVPTETRDPKTNRVIPHNFND